MTCRLPAQLGGPSGQIGRCPAANGDFLTFDVFSQSRCRYSSPLLSADLPSVDFCFGQAIRTPAFWVFAIGAGAFNLIWSALTLFNESILKEHRFDAHAAISVMAMLVGTGLLSNLVGGALVRRHRIGWLLGAGLATLAVALCYFPRVTTNTALMSYAAGIGIAGGLVTVVFFAAWSSVFGRAQVGRIQGLAQLITVVASASGPDLIAEGRALCSSYSPMFYVAAAATGALALAACFVRVPAVDATTNPSTAAPVASVPATQEA
jgi:MFS family permease